MTTEPANPVDGEQAVATVAKLVEHSAWTSIAGRASIVHDQDKAEELWFPALEVWFGDGLETPGLAGLTVETETAEYWDAPDSKVKQPVGGLRAVASGDPQKFPADNETVRLDER